MADIKQYVKAAEEKMTFAIEYLDETVVSYPCRQGESENLGLRESNVLRCSCPFDKCGYRNCTGCKNDHDHPVGEEDYQRY